MSAGAAQQAVLSARPPVPSPTPPQQRSPDPASDAHASIPLNVKGLVEAARRVRGSTHSLAALALHSTLVAAAFGTRIRLASAGNAAAPQAPPARTVEAVAAVLLHARQFSELLADMPLLRQLLRQLQTSRTVAMLHSQLERLSESMQLDVRKVEGVGQLAVDDLRNAVDKLLGLLDKDLIPTNQ
nr:hypothetical protein HK105_004471 [Polyrhizophydium stewartii]